jgi:hypothetical protein
MNLKEKFGYTKMDRIDPSVISIDGADNMVAHFRSCGLKFGELDVVNPSI